MCKQEYDERSQAVILQLAEQVGTILVPSFLVLRHLLYCRRGSGIRVVRVVDLESLAPHCCGFKSHQELWILSFEGT